MSGLFDAVLLRERGRIARHAALVSASRLVPPAALATLAFAILAGPWAPFALALVLFGLLVVIARAWLRPVSPIVAALALDARGPGDDSFLAAVELPPGAAASAARARATRWVEEGRLVAAAEPSWRRPVALGVAALAMAMLVAVRPPLAAPRGDDLTRADEVAEATLAADALPASGVKEEREVPVPEASEALPVEEAELEAALLALQAERERARRALDAAAAFREAADALAEALLQWEAPEAEAAAEAAAREDWAEAAERLREWAESMRQGDSEQRPRPRQGAEAAASDSAEALAQAMGRAGDQGGAEAAGALARAARGQSDPAGAADSLAEAASRADAMQQAAQQAAGTLGEAEGKRNALADSGGGSGSGEPAASPMPGQDAGTERGAEDGEAAASLPEASLSASAVSGQQGSERRDQRTVLGDRADEVGATATEQGDLAGQASSTDRMNLDAVPARHREAVRRYFSAGTNGGGTP